jgi:hypothetical protein
LILVKSHPRRKTIIPGRDLAVPFLYQPLHAAGSGATEVPPHVRNPTFVRGVVARAEARGAGQTPAPLSHCRRAKLSQAETLAPPPNYCAPAIGIRYKHRQGKNHSSTRSPSGADRITSPNVKRGRHARGVSRETGPKGKSTSTGGRPRRPTSVSLTYAAWKPKNKKPLLRSDSAANGSSGASCAPP